MNMIYYFFSIFYYVGSIAANPFVAAIDPLFAANEYDLLLLLLFFIIV